MKHIKFWYSLNVKPLDIDIEDIENIEPEHLQLLALYKQVTTLYAQHFHEDLLKIVEQEQISCIECEPLQDKFVVIVTTKKAHQYRLGYIDTELQTIKLY